MQIFRQLHIACAPIWPPNSGYKQSVLGRIWESVQSGTDMVVLALNNESATTKGLPQLPETLAGIQYHEVQSDSVRKPWVEFVNLFTREPRFARIFSTEKFRCSVALAVKAHAPDEIVAESIWALGAIERSEWDKVNLVIIDVTSDLLRSAMQGERSWLRKLFHWRDLQRCATFEANLFRDFRGRITFLTREDWNYYQRNFGLAANQCQLASNRLMMSRLERRVRHDAPFLLFPGSVEFHQNFTALKWAAEKVWPLVDTNLRSFITVIVTGRASEKKRKQLDDLGMPIVWTGEIPYAQLDGLYSSCLCLISPIISGTGIKVKNLEAVEKGIPLVTTRLSARGIDSPLCYRAADDSAEAFAKMLNTCVTHELNALSSHY